MVSGCTGPGEPSLPTAEGEYAFVDEPYRVRSGPLLARPSAVEEQNTTFLTLLGLIRHTPSGETIRIVGNSFSFVPVAEALVAAAQRDVRVQVVIDRSVSSDWEAPELLRDRLGTDLKSDSFVHLAAGELHQKSWSFTRTGHSRHVVLLGSMNLTYQSARQYTDTVAFVGRRDMLRALDLRFDQLVAQLPDVESRSSQRLGRDRLWFHPGYTEATDPVQQQLSAVPPVGARIRVVMYAWLDERGIALAEQLAGLAAAGADVEVVLGRSVGPRPRAILEASAVTLHDGVFRDGTDIHHKLTMVDYSSGAGRRRFVLTGSDNYTSRSLNRPELLLRIDADHGSTWRRYQRFVDAIVSRARREADVG